MCEPTRSRWHIDRGDQKYGFPYPKRGVPRLAFASPESFNFSERERPFHALPMEDVIQRFPEVLEAVVFGIPDSRFGEVPVALLRLASETDFDQREFLDWATAHVKGPVGLRAVRVVSSNEIPRGLTRKVLKRVLRDQYRFLADSETGCTAQRLQYESEGCAAK